VKPKTWEALRGLGLSRAQACRSCLRCCMPHIVLRHRRARRRFSRFTARHPKWETWRHIYDPPNNTMRLTCAGCGKHIFVAFDRKWWGVYVETLANSVLICPECEKRDAVYRVKT
jgi:hypothetical protein